MSCTFKSRSNQKPGNYVTGVKLKLFCPEAKNSSPLLKFIDLWGADLIGSQFLPFLVFAT
jgi:hypothetical protein